MIYVRQSNKEWPIFASLYRVPLRGIFQAYTYLYIYKSRRLGIFNSIKYKFPASRKVTSCFTSGNIKILRSCPSICVTYLMARGWVRGESFGTLQGHKEALPRSPLRVLGVISLHRLPPAHGR